MVSSGENLERRVLVYGLSGGDATLTERLLRSAGIESMFCPDFPTLEQAIRSGAGAVILTEESLTRAVGAELKRILDDQPPWSDLPVVACTAQRFSGDGVLGELVEHANIMLVERPMRVRTMIVSVRAALRARFRQYQARELVERLAVSETRFRKVQEASPDALMILQPTRDICGRICDFVWIYTNPAGERMLRQPGDQLRGKHLGALMPEIKGDGHFAAYVRVYEQGSGEVREFCRRDNAGNSVYRNVAFRLDDDLALIFEDISDQRRAELARVELLENEKLARERAEAANRSKDEFLATVSHELRTPLNAMLGWARMLSAGSLDAAQTRRALSAVERNAVAQAQLIEDLLDISRIISGKLRLDLQVVNLSEVIEAAVDSVRPAMQAKGIEFRLKVEPGASHVTADPNRLQQVVWNLLSNAIKFTPKGGHIELRAVDSETHVEFVVKDDGEGIEHNFAPYLFQRFQQADGSVTRPHGGLGLGLAISRHLVELHGGTIHAHSEGPGRGSTFRVRLPIVVEQNSERPRLHAYSLPPRNGKLECPTELRGLRVLVVDDEPDAREVLCAVLTQCGAVPIEAESAADALDAVTTTPPDVILSDIGMPVLDGYQLIQRIRALPRERGGRTPAAALTAFARAEDRRRAMKAGFELHVAKPIEPAELVAAVATLARIGNALK